MALTKAQVSLVTVATLGAAPGGFTADLLNFGSQVEVAALALSVSPTQAAQTNAEFALQVAKNLGATDALSLYKALEAGTSRADAVVDFANAQLVAQGGNIASVKAATESTSTSTDLAELVTIVTPNATAATDATIIEFKDNNGSAKPGAGNDISGTPIATQQTIAYVGKDQIINGKATKVAADFTFQLKDQIGETDTFTGQFLSPILESEKAEATGSQVILELRNLREAVDSVEPLKSLPTNGIAFTLNGALLKIADQGTNEAIHNALTYDDLRTALENRLAELARGENLPDGTSGESTNPADYAKLATITVTKGVLFTAQNEKGETVSGNQIVLTDSAGAKLEPLAFTQSSGIIADQGYTLYGQLRKEEASDVLKLITTNLDADNVGYGSQGASVNIAGQSNSDKGVQELLVQAKNGVWFTKLESKSKAETDHLQKITLKAGSEGSFRVGTQENSLNHVVSLVKEDFRTAGLKDVQQVEAGNAGSTAINSFVSKDVLARYTLKDTGNFDADESNITYNLSSGRDVLNLAISTDVLEAVDTKVSVNTGAGNDVITVQATTGLQTAGADAGKINAVEQVTSANAGWLVNQQLNNNIVINAGDGDDWILTPGAGNATINAGTGNDVVRVDNAGDRGVFVFNNATTDIKKLSTNQDIVSNSDNKLSAGVSTTTAQTYNFFKAKVQVKFQGFESKFITIDSTNYTTSTKQINQAIKAAVNNDPVLSKLIFAIDNEGNALAIESLIDGLLSTTDLSINITTPVAYDSTETAAQKATREATGQDMLANGEAAKANEAYAKAGSTDTTTNLSANITAANGLYSTEFGTFGAVIAGAGATASLNASGFDFTKAITVTIGGTEVLAAATYADADALAIAIQNLGNVTTATNTTGTIAIQFNPTANGAANPAIAVKAENVVASVTIAGAAGADNTTGATATIDTTGFAFGAGSETTVDLGNGVTIAAAAAADADALATAIQAHADVATAANAAGTITITFVDADNTAIDPARPVSVTNVLVGEDAGTVGTVGTPAPNVAGTKSGAESDNVIDLGTGNDVLVMGTGDFSNDTLKVVGYNLGEKTIVNFDHSSAPAANNGADLLDFSAYLTSVNATTKATVAKTVNTTAFVDNSVTIVTFDNTNLLKTGDTALTFDQLNDANVKALLNDASGTSAGAITGLKGGLSATAVSNNVFMVENNTNLGEYKAFHVTTGATSATADVKLIGTFDFGETISLADGNLA